MFDQLFYIPTKLDEEIGTYLLNQNRKLLFWLDDDYIFNLVVKNNNEKVTYDFAHNSCFILFSWCYLSRRKNISFETKIYGFSSL